MQDTLNIDKVDTFAFATHTFYPEYNELPDHGMPMVGRPYCVADDPIVLGGIMLMLLLMAFALRHGRAMLLDRVKSFFTRSRRYSVEATQSSATEKYDVIALKIVALMSLSLILFTRLSRALPFNEALGIPYWLIGAAFSAFVVLFTLRSVVYDVVNWTFWSREQRVGWSRGLSLLNALSALLWFPISLFYLLGSYSDVMVAMLASFVYFLYEMLLIYKLFVNFSPKKNEYLLIISYLCAVEIMSALVLWNTWEWAFEKFVLNNILY